MFRNYLISALRSQWKHKNFFIIHISGLVIGITACLGIFKYINHELSYDKFHINKDRLYRVAMHKYEQDSPPQSFAFTFPAVSHSLKRDFPEVEEAIRMRRQTFLTKYQDKVYSETVYFVDEPFLTMFSFPFLEGDPEKAFTDPSSVVISEEMSVKYFGTESPLNKHLLIPYQGDWRPFRVTGVFGEIPENSHMDFDFLYPYRTYSEAVKQFGSDAENNWQWSDFYTYILLEKGTDVRDLESKLGGFTDRYMGDLFREYGYRIEFDLQPLTDIHLKSALGYEMKSNGSIQYVRVMGLIAFFILLLAWINYINLSTARSLDRAREVGVRKVIGAGKTQLIAQFLVETFLVCGIALAISFLLFKLVQPWFIHLTGKELQGQYWSQGTFWLIFFSIYIVGSFLAGAYPAVVLSNFKPIMALKNSWQLAGLHFSNTFMRKTLVSSQFCIAIALIASTLAMQRQITFLQNQDPGIKMDQTLILRNQAMRDSNFVENNQKLITEFKNHPEILDITASGDIPGKEVGNSTSMRWSQMPATSIKRVRTFAIDDQFMDVYDLDIIAGRNFSREFGTEDNNIILNETAVKVLSLESPENAVGKEITNSDGSSRLKVVGVIKDYHQESLRYQFKPIVYFFTSNNWSYFSIKFNTSGITGFLSDVENIWKNVHPNAPFNHFFLDEYYSQQHVADIRFGQIVGLFTILSLFVACLGLFGMFSFNVSKRTKEIGIRKVLGANSIQIVMLISKEFMRILLISSAIALPLAWFITNKWLNSYAFRIELNIWFFLIPVILVIFIAWITVGGQSLKASFTNPVDSLRDE